jgi:hypothetical protein
MASAPADPALLEGLLVRADAALYRAKEGGRNRVEAAPPWRGGELQGADSLQDANGQAAIL